MTWIGTQGAGLPAATAQEIPLFKALPSLARSAPRVPLLQGATPIERLPGLQADLEREVGAPPAAAQAPRDWLWIKRDDRVSSPRARELGGNKARKLEFVLGKAQRKGARKLVTAGMLGSNHALATALAAKGAGPGVDLSVELILGPQPVTEDVKRKLLAFHALGAKMRRFPGKLTMGLALARAMARDALSGGKTFYVPPGGSSMEGDLGYVNAFLELVEQLGGVERLPARIVVPVGTMGTAAGLLVGSCLAGAWEKTELVGVATADPLLSNEGALRAHAARLHRWITKRLSAQDLARLPAAARSCDYKKSRRALRFSKEWYAPEYGAAKPEVHRAIDRARAADGVVLDATYTGKAMQWLIADAVRGLKAGTAPPPTLFWHTFHEADLDAVIRSHPWKDPARPWLDLPKPFRSAFSPK